MPLKTLFSRQVSNYTFYFILEFFLFLMFTSRIFLDLIQLLIKTMLSEFLLSVDVLSETAITVADVVRGNYANQKYLSSSTISHPDSPGELK